MNRSLALLLLASVAAAGGCRSAGTADGGTAATPAHAITNGAEVVAAMHDRYADTWYRTLRFRQTVVRTRADGSHPPEEVWLEHAEIPGKLRIDRGREYSGDGYIYADDSLFVFQGGKVTRRLAQRNVLLILGFDVYRQSVGKSIQILVSEGFDLGRVHTDTWQGRPVWVVGAPAGDLHTAQFWIDRERLVFVRLIQPGRGANAGLQDIRFDDYRPLGQGWISPLVRFLVDGKEIDREEYFDIQVDPVLREGLFDPARWAEGGAKGSGDGGAAG